ncbi:MAG TPA: hypothetical protein VE693_01055 [Gaiellaceae bacterium]|jgi:hypothetical protein|nr:hypothetical protein [Gaiellaceae bacterium]
MSTYEDVWTPESDSWGLDRLAWEDDEDGFVSDPDERPETLGDGRD